MDFKTFFASEVAAVNSALNKILVKEFPQSHPILSPLFSTYKDAHQEGKRLRAVLVKLGYMLAGGIEHDALIKPQAAVEVFHTAILAHDDIVDQSELRRGKPTVHQALGNDHHAISQTIILADFGLFLSTKLLNECKFQAENKIKAMQIFQETVLDTAIGEILDIEIPYQKLKIKEDDALTISLFKTARYTITGPLQIGAALAGADDALLEKLQDYGDDLGTAFQIQDDILGVFGEVEEMGKSNLSDMEEGKVTLLAAYAFAHGSPEDRDELEKLYGKKMISESEAETIRELFKKTGALDFAREKALEYALSAKKVIPEITETQVYREYLEKLADLLIERKK